MRHRPTLESLLPVSSALITYRSNAGVVQVATASWVGIACAGFPVLAVGLSHSEGPLEKLGPAGTFMINLPAGAVRPARPQEVGREEDAEFTVVEGGIVGAPMIAECPVRIECRRGTVRSLFKRETLCGEVVGLYRGDEAVARPRASEIFRFDPLSAYGPEVAMTGRNSFV